MTYCGQTSLYRTPMVPVKVSAIRTCTLYIVLDFFEEEIIIDKYLTILYVNYDSLLSSYTRLHLRIFRTICTKFHWVHDTLHGDAFFSFPWKTRSPFASFYCLSEYLKWLFFLLKSVQLIFDDPSTIRMPICIIQNGDFFI